MTTPAEIPVAGGNGVDTSKWPLIAQYAAHFIGPIVALIIAVAPLLFKDDADDKPKGEYYTKAEVQQLIDSAVFNIRYNQQTDIDDLFTWTSGSFQLNRLPTLNRPTSFRDRSNPPQFPQLQSQEAALPPREYPYQKKQGTK